MYPLNLSLAVGIGYAVANNAAEHKELTDRGYISTVAGPPGIPPPELLAPGVPSIQEKKGPGRPRKVIE